MSAGTIRSRETRLVDLALALLTGVGVGLGPAMMGAPLLWHGAPALGVLLGGLLLARRYRPRLVLVLSAVVLIGYQSSGLFEGGWVWPLSAALFTASLTRPGWAAGVGVLTLAYGMGWQGLGVGEVLARGGVELLWLAVMLAGASATRQYNRWRAEHQARLLQLEQTRLAEQRLHISREVHDVVAHTLAVVGVHLNVAVEALDDSPEEARAALRTAIAVRNQATRDLKAFVGELRDTPQQGLESVAVLVAQARAAGLEVRYEPEGDLAAIPAAQALTAYRVVQEAVINTLRHSNADCLTIRLRVATRDLEVRVVDNGSAAADFTAGHGLTGMRERVTALGGTLRIDAGRGFAVQAVLPLTAHLSGLAP
ncbi:sensor histidine kinase [Streptosporangium sandarakinum]|uniref:sensor histidine kinase n=1 Tax=Streptosporangium sandarakinum TaxID=1260955 RepID=UPI003691AFDD